MFAECVLYVVSAVYSYTIYVCIILCLCVYMLCFACIKTCLIYLVESLALQLSLVANIISYICILGEACSFETLFASKIIVFLLLHTGI